MSVDAGNEYADGVLGRLAHAVSHTHATGAYSIDGDTKVLEGDRSYDIMDKYSGITRFDEDYQSTHLLPYVGNMTAPVSESLFSETWSAEVGSLLESNSSRHTPRRAWGVPLQLRVIVDDVVGLGGGYSSTV